MKQQRFINRTKVWGASLLVIFILSISLVIFFSPYGNHKNYGHKLVQESILINAPVNQVFSYLGNSKNASQWSVYVSHITTINEQEVPDGEKGSIRRCFVNKDESGQRWDEEIMATKINERRLLRCYNFVGYEMGAGTVLTEQVYEETKSGQCLLSLTLFLPPEKSTFVKHLKMYFGTYKAASVFEKNLQNIKQLIEENP